MPAMTFILPGGKQQKVEAAAGTSLLDIAHANGIPIEGACEGCLACATCHVVVAEDHYARLPEPTEDEDDMLDFAVGVTDTSRLGCQVQLTEDLDGLVVTLPEDVLDVRGL